MTATDELRLPNDTNELDMLLNERGQEHRVWPSGRVVWHDESTVYEYEPAKNHHDEYWGGILRMTMRHLTPEQAIAATLGATDARPTQAESSGTCHVESSIIDTYEYNRWEYELSCGHTIIWEDSEPPNYCPNCGRRCVG